MVEESKEFDGQAEPVSKSQRKRDALEVRSIAVRLIGLGSSQLEQVPLSDSLRSEIDRARGIRSNVARKRQLQYVAKLLRREGTEDVAAALAAFDTAARQVNARHHRSEAWRDHLIESGDTGIGELIEQRRDADAQTLRQLVRNAQRDARNARPPSAARALFRVLRELDESAPLPPLEEA